MVGFEAQILGYDTVLRSSDGNRLLSHAVARDGAPILAPI